MKDMRDDEASRSIGSDKMMRDQELQHLVQSSIPSPPYSGLSLISTSSGGITVLDPIYSAHLLASIAASNHPPGTRFQLPIPIPMAVPATAPRMFEYTMSTSTIPVNGHQAATIPNNAQLDILSSWVTDHTANEERKISGNKTVKNNIKNNNNNNNNKETNNKKRGTNFSVNKANKKNKGAVQDGLITSVNRLAIKKDHVDDMNIKPTIIPIDKTSKVVVSGDKKCENEDAQTVDRKNNNNNKGSIQHQQSNQQSRDKVFTCPICKRCFGYKHVLQNHERTHTGEKPYFCKICDKRFTRDHHLKTHMRLHTGEKPYNCVHCARQFVQVANLRRHLRVHTGERPYSCNLCSSRFSDSNQLKSHVLMHNDISPPSSNKRERKSRETRRIIRVAGLPVSATITSGLDSYLPPPEQTHPEDLSLGTGNGLRNRHFSGSHSSVSASPSPTSGGSHGSLGPYCHSVSSSEPAEFYSDEERMETADSCNSGKNDSDEHPSPSQG